MNELRAELQKLYSDATKHSVYQNIPDFVSSELGYSEVIDETWRGDRPRLAYLKNTRPPLPNEMWVDFGANTGFFTLSLAREFPRSSFTAVEANPNHARFIELVARYFALENVEVIQQAVGLEQLDQLPQSHFMLHLNVLHHAGHDFDAHLVPNIDDFHEYARRYLELLRHRTSGMLFQVGSNWGGDKARPLAVMRDDPRKLKIFAGWLLGAGWDLHEIAYPHHDDSNGVLYDKLSEDACRAAGHNHQDNQLIGAAIQAFDLDSFRGEFYRRPLFLCGVD